ncbi:class I SAM-dependent methyltransferase [Streptomyces albus]|uniref:Class I SAM-dependent methyltransferase n=1 Tax=Streptomyces albus TaxID=1888 RepID=A0A8H1LLM7_9ACTN|nr:MULTISPECIES: class I SAM-dependent methyltransferase [Streptomyces]EPD97326.1 hypothetical protein HMPREF1486_00112 [Streptomyces sp. HPH0547]TGG87110.1 class I SAM-dependent methyltransferase [Streptomyces albus]UVN58546.1 methyltransferase domain-containing protein [Streptomyces albus]
MADIGVPTADGGSVNDKGSWEEYWHGVRTGRLEEPPWNWDPERAADCYLSQREALGDAFDPSLLLIDLGCGDGSLTRYLARTHTRVLGVDVSESALDQARRQNPAPNVRYQRFDITDEAAARELHRRQGDAHIHLRGVVHSIAPADRKAALASLAVLAGESGTVFDIELSPALDAAQAETVRAHGQLPDRMEHVGDSGLRAQRLTASELAELYEGAGFAVRAGGEYSGRSSMRMPDGSCFVYPMVYVLAVPAHSTGRVS